MRFAGCQHIEVHGAARCALISLVLVGCGPSTQSSTPANPAGTSQIDLPKPPEARPDDYVGSQVCAECHREIANRYFQHPMGRASGRVAAAASLEQYGAKHGFTSADGCRFEAIEQDGRIWHSQRLSFREGDPVYEHRFAMDLTIGSGRRGRSYGFLRGNQFFQSPLSWYSSKSSWGLSPGFTLGRHQQFDRLLTEWCLNCHVGRMHPGVSPNTWDRNEPVAEFQIGCERCHGPAASHVERYRAPQTFSGVDRIVNPTKLDAIRRDAVCHQCHLQSNQTIARFGRRAMDFRPGDRLADVWVVLLDDASEGQAVTQSEQMLGSTCYRSSKGTFGCVSCHDPHALPVGDPEVYFDQKCLVCHGSEQTQCAAEASDRTQKTCVGCHMPRFNAKEIPHTALTDHRILRYPISPQPAVKSPSKREVFDEGEPALPASEIQRARVLALRADPSSLRSDIELQRVGRTLRELQEQFAGDPELWEAIAWLEGRRGKWPESELAARRAVALAPEQVSAREVLVEALVKRQAWPDAMRVCDELVARDPGNAAYLAILAEASWRSGDRHRAVDAAEKSLSCDPAQHELRRHVAEEYRRTGQSDAALRHQRVLERWPAAK